MCWLSWNLGASNSWNPMGLSRPVMGLLYFYLMLTQAHNLFMNIWYSTQQKFSKHIYILRYMFNNTLDWFSVLPANQLWEVLPCIILQHLCWLQLHIFRNPKLPTEQVTYVDNFQQRSNQNHDRVKYSDFIPTLRILQTTKMTNNCLQMNKKPQTQYCTINMKHNIQPLQMGKIYTN
jgi:hypothetical protein